MNDQRTTSILQRLSVVLAVTAASYGLPAQAHGQRSMTSPRHIASAAVAPAASERAQAPLPTQR